MPNAELHRRVSPGPDLAGEFAMKWHCLGLIGVILFAAPVSARAQSEFKAKATQLARKAGVHFNTSFRESADHDVSKGTTMGVSIGLSPGRTNGWRYPVGLTMFSEDLHSPSGESFASIESKAILAGIGYGWHFGRLSTGASLQTGYAFNHGQAQGDIQHAFNVPNGAVSLHVENSMLLRPQVKAEYFITPQFTIRGSTDYMLLRPNITVTTPTGEFVNWNASNFHANVGVGWYPFRK